MRLAAVMIAASAAGLSSTAASVPGAVSVYHTKPFLTSDTTQFGALIEGAAVDKDGNFYAVHYGDNKAAIGKAFSSQCSLFEDKASPNSWFNGIRFNVDKRGIQEAYLADVVNHRVVRLRDVGKNGKFAHSETLCQNSGILQPNDLAIAHKTGRIFLSGMRFKPDSVIGDGDLWTCDSSGKATKLGEFYRTNGVEVSPDEKTLYLSEAINKGGEVVSNKILAFDLDSKAGKISNRRVFVDFASLDGTASNDVDGMRADVDGNLYVARWGSGKVAKISPKGKLLAYFQLSNIKEVTNLELAGPKGKDLFVVGACVDDPSKGCVERFVGNKSQGRAFANLQKKN
ncbi:hypothetical protein FBU59_002931 [Linderina macrospora]|uniref:Uncharacterized protein n=1 Tax=Linderina macrospora TaxID=4868 RepID=A0ACC1J9U4_9FUNG|nr:hypothetical protein FBU59_002931 [Linderina macrospora]